MTPLAWALPFAALLVSIAILPLVAKRRWSDPWFQAAVAAAAAAPVFIRFLLRDLSGLGELLEHYFSFIAMLGSLYIVTSGISIRADVPAHPLTNAGILLAGGCLASVIGTTGASMLLIRLLLDINSERKRVAHTVLFFILIVSNVGGCLTPLGDPPLLLGYLSGVPFLFTLRLLPHWGVAVGFLLGVYLVVERRAYRLESTAALLNDEKTRKPFQIRGGWNFVLLAGIVSATALLPWMAREAVYIVAAFASFLVTPRGLRDEVGFRWHPLIEIAVLFAGIFVAMGPALAILTERSGQLGFHEPWQFFWGSGALSAGLDNAPTYAAFLALARGLGRSEVAGAPVAVLEAISAGAVFFGALTYIGNGPNFLVRSIAESRGVEMPSFFGYAFRAALVLLPLFVLQTFLFFRP